VSDSGVIKFLRVSCGFHAGVIASPRNGGVIEDRIRHCARDPQQCHCFFSSDTRFLGSVTTFVSSDTRFLSTLAREPEKGSKRGPPIARIYVTSVRLLCSLHTLFFARRSFCKMTTLLDIRSLWRLPLASKRRLNSTSTSSSTSTRRPHAPAQASQPTSVLRKVIGMSNPNVLDMPASYFWQLVNDTWTSDENGIVVSIIGDLLRDSVEDKSLPWYSS